MSWITIIWSGAAGICLTLAGLHLLVWLRAREFRGNLPYSVWATSIACSAIFELALMHARTPEQYGELIRWSHLPLILATVSYIWFAGSYLGAGRKWLMSSIYSLAVLELAVNFVSRSSVAFSEITALNRVPFLGEQVAIPVVVTNPWIWIGRINSLLILLFVIDAAIMAWRKDRHRKAMVMGLALFTSSVGAMLLSGLVQDANRSFPITVSLPSLAAILVVFFDLGSDLVRAQKALRELADTTQQRMSLATKAANIGVWEWDVIRDEIWANSALRSRLGLREDERLNLERFLQSLQPDDREATRGAVQQAVVDGRAYRTQYRMLSATGQLRWIEAHGQVERGIDGKPLRMRGVSFDITERKQAEVALRANEERLREAGRMARLGNWEWDAEADRVSWSEEVFTMFGISPDTPLTYARLREAVHPDDREYHDRHTAGWLKNNGGDPFQYRVVHPDGSIRHIYAIGKVECNAEGRPIRLFGTVQDITERHEREEALRESEERFRHVADTAPVLIWMSGEDKLCTYFNKCWLDYTGRSLEQELGNGWAEGVHPDDLRQCLEIYTTSFDARREFTMQYRLRKHDGKYGWVLDTGVPRFAADSRFLGYIGSCVDITSQKEAEERIRESSEFNEKVLASFHNHIAILDRNGTIVAVNDAWKTFSVANAAVSSEVGVGVNYLKVCERAGAAGDVILGSVLQGIRSVLEGARDFFELEYPCSSPTEFRSFLMRVVPLKTSSGGAVVSHTDLTQLRRAELEAQQLHRELAHVSRIVMLGELASGLAHELSQPLAATLSNAQAALRFMEAGATDLAELRAILIDIVSDDKRAGEVVNRLRAMAEKGPAPRESCYLNEIVREVLQILNSELIAQSVTTRLELEEALAPVYAGRVDIQQVLINLVLNAVQAMKDTPRDKRTVTLQTQRSDGNLILTVRDRGHGIQEDALSQIFNPFFTTRRSGLGMGLAISRRLVEALGGRIQAQNRPEGGAEFTVSLPVYIGLAQEAS